jgi:hypothetical protein
MKRDLSPPHHLTNDLYRAGYVQKYGIAAAGLIGRQIEEGALARRYYGRI